ncbi:DUF445 family protein [Nocardia acidivorans]|uniref:DUF445 family protein n=1 Tax=Nocardia acidivorans TaxID=404580 RepID=UPI00082F54C2|nr:DUF445 family protein [Nocardia acidivorans]
MWLELITIPLFTGVIGYVTNWTGILMLFEPIRFHGFRLPGLRWVFPYLPRRIQVLPLLSDDGRIGWQGIVPSRAEKMSSIAVDKGFSKLGSMSDFYRELDPDGIAEQLVTLTRPEIPAIVARILERRNPQLWFNLPESARELVYRRVAEQLPTSARAITDAIGEYIEELIDPKWMTIRHLTANPRLINRIFREIAAAELRFMQNFGFYFGFPMGFVLVAVLHFFPYWWVLPLGGVVIGYIVNWVGITMIYEPLHPKWWVPWRQGLMLRRRNEIADGYAEIIAGEVMTPQNLARELLAGPRADRTTAMLDSILSASIDQAVGQAKPALRFSLGRSGYDRLKSDATPEILSLAHTAFSDPSFLSSQTARIRDFVAIQMRALDRQDFVDLLRSATRQDEWLLFVHGAALGVVGGLIHLAIFGV